MYSLAEIHVVFVRSLCIEYLAKINIERSKGSAVLESRFEYYSRNGNDGKDNFDTEGVKRLSDPLFLEMFVLWKDTPQETLHTSIHYLESLTWTSSIPRPVALKTSQRNARFTEHKGMHLVCTPQIWKGTIVCNLNAFEGKLDANLQRKKNQTSAGFIKSFHFLSIQSSTKITGARIRPRRAVDVRVNRENVRGTIISLFIDQKRHRHLHTRDFIRLDASGSQR